MVQGTYQQKTKALAAYLQITPTDIAYYKTGEEHWAFEYDGEVYDVLTQEESDDEAYLSAIYMLQTLSFDKAKEFLKPGISSDVYSWLQELGDEGIVALKYLLQNADKYVEEIITMYGKGILLSKDGLEGTSGQYLIYRID